MATDILKITLAHIHPPISRTVRVPSDATLADLHDVIQASFGWDDSHLHEFKIGDARYTAPHPKNDPDGLDESSVSLADVLPRKGASAEYIYDFGDWWIHNIVVESVDQETASGGSHSLRRSGVECIDAKRACPPKNCGGPFGYGELMETLADPNHGTHAELSEWIGGAFDAEHVDVAAINKRLASMRV